MADASCIFEYVCSKLTENGMKVRRPPTPTSLSPNTRMLPL